MAALAGAGDGVALDVWIAGVGYLRHAETSVLVILSAAKGLYKAE
jgi:hypothetical protein